MTAAPCTCPVCTGRPLDVDCDGEEETCWDSKLQAALEYSYCYPSSEHEDESYRQQVALATDRRDAALARAESARAAHSNVFASWLLGVRA